MKNKEIQVLIKADGHANLDSFPFRFGYSFPQNAQLTIRDWEPIRDETAHDPGRRKVIVGSFTLPNEAEGHNYIVSIAVITALLVYDDFH